MEDIYKDARSGKIMAQMTLRKYAKGKPCMVRLGICNGDSATTVLAHLSGGGMGMKHPDYSGGAWCCSSCHDVIDGRDSSLDSFYDREELRAKHLDGIVRTQQELLKTLNRHGVTQAEAIEEWTRGLEL